MHMREKAVYASTRMERLGYCSYGVDEIKEWFRSNLVNMCLAVKCEKLISATPSPV